MGAPSAATFDAKRERVVTGEPGHLQDVGTAMLTAARG